MEFKHRPRLSLSADNSAGSQQVVQLNALCVSEGCHFVSVVTAEHAVVKVAGGIISETAVLSPLSIYCE